MDNQVREVDTAALAGALAGAAVVVDVREPAEYAAGHVPAARNIPLASVPLRAAELTGAGEVYVICQSGGRSYQGAQALLASGVPAVSVAGGTSEWIAAGHPVVTGVDPS